MSTPARRALTAALVLVVLCSGGASARARRGGDRAADRGAARVVDRSVDLDAAQHALDRLRYEEARPLLERAWRSGQNGPQALGLLFRLQGEVAATLGDEAGARRAFARWLALDPTARLDEGSSPKLAASFAAASRQLDGAALRIDVEIVRDGAAVALVVVSDPLAMIVGARASYRGDDGVSGSVEGKGGARVELPLPTGKQFRVVVAAVDGFGNRLVDRELVVGQERAHPSAAPPPAPPPPPALAPAPSPAPAPDESLTTSPPPAPASQRSIFASPWLWAGVSAGCFVAGGVFAWQVSQAQTELDDLNATSAQHSFAEARAVEDRLHTSATGSYVLFAAAGATAIVGVFLAVQTPHAEVTEHLSLRPAPGGGSVAYEWSF